MSATLMPAGEVRVSATGSGITRCLVFTQEQPFGRNGRRREVRIAVPLVTLGSVHKLAQLLFAGCELGAHAVWHLERPAAPFPCPGDSLNPPCNQPSAR